MISEQLYVQHHTYFIYDTLCTIHKVTPILWVHTIVVTTLPQCIHDITHTIYNITHMITQKLYLPPHRLYLTLQPLYLCHQTQCINCITPTLCMTLHTICMTSHSVCMTSHEHFMTSRPYRYDITSSIFMTSYPIYMISPILFLENQTTIPGISSTVFDITATASVWSHLLYQCLHNNYGGLHTWHTYDIIHTLHHIKFSDDIKWWHNDVSWMNSLNSWMNWNWIHEWIEFMNSWMNWNTHTHVYCV